jgi:hypothetical protein
MARVFIIGSFDRLRSMSAKVLIEQEHSIVLHTRNH